MSVATLTEAHRPPASLTTPHLAHSERSDRSKRSRPSCCTHPGHLLHSGGCAWNASGVHAPAVLLHGTVGSSSDKQWCQPASHLLVERYWLHRSGEGQEPSPKCMGSSWISGALENRAVLKLLPPYNVVPGVPLLALVGEEPPDGNSTQCSRQSDESRTSVLRRMYADSVP